MIALPVDEKIPEILEALKEANSLVLSAAPGAGKTTRLPPALLEMTSRQVWVLEPRRVAAVAAAHRIAEEKGWQVGREIGYQVRFDNKTGKETRLVFLTEALLARKLLQDPLLTEVGIVVLDEFHERSIHTDLALGLLKELQMLARPELKIVIMSATLDSRPLSEFLDNCPWVDVPGRLRDLQIRQISASQLLRTDFRFVDRVVDQVRSHIQNFSDGKDLLVFLPGQSEISRCQEKLAAWAENRNLSVLPLTGSLKLEDQFKALRPQPRRKIILATNVAESSLTIDGVDTVIDSGLARVVKRHPKTEFEQLVISRISKASAKQRAGRAARQFDGICYRLWNSQDELSMPEFETAEIQRIDLAETVLFLKSLGISEAGSFSWFDAPPAKSLASAESLLEEIGATKDGHITAHGKRLAEVPLPPRTTQVLVTAEKLGAPALGCDLCALIGEKDLRVPETAHVDDDFTERLDSLDAFRKTGKGGDQRTLTLIDRSSRQLQKYVKSRSSVGNDRAKLSEILLLSFPDRLCRRRGHGRRQALMVGGRGVELAESSLVKKAEFFVAVDLMEVAGSADTQVRRAAAVDKTLIEKHFARQFSTEKHLRFDESNGRFYIEEATTLWELPLEEPRRRPATAEEVQEHLPEIFVDRWEQVLKDNEPLQTWWQRWLYYEKRGGREEFWSNEIKRRAFQQAAMGESRWLDVVGKNLIYFFESLLDPQTVEDFHRKCPPRLTVPTGNQLQLHYHSDKDPHLEVRLQELFGLSATPSVWDGQVPVTLHLLGPNYRPVQMTSDLAGFWRNTYAEVRKELRARYPKHSWPEDPLAAPPVAKGRSRR